MSINGPRTAEPTKGVTTNYDPTVYVTGRQTVLQDELDRFLRDHNVTWATDSQVGSEVLSETAGRVCYMSFAKPRPGGNEAYLQHIKESGHGSVLEHGVYNMIFTGVSRTLTHELVRHRAGWAYSQLSQRYVDESVCEVVVPEELRQEVQEAEAWLRGFGRAVEEALTVPEVLENPSLLAGVTWISLMSLSSKTYRSLTDYLVNKVGRRFHQTYLTKVKDVTNLTPWTFVEYMQRVDAETRRDIRKAARGPARSVLPNATETKVFVTANVRALRHFIEMRAHPAAEVEIRKLAYRVWQEMRAEAPNLFGDYVPEELPDGTFALTTEWKKV